MPQATSSFGAIRVPIVDEKGMPQHDFLKKFQEYETKLQSALTILGQISSKAVIQGRTEGIGTTVGQLTNVGQLASTDQIAADGTGSPLTGGKRGFVALDTNNRLANSFRATGVNVSSTPTSTTTFTNNGIATIINIAGSSNQFAPGAVAYNSGSVDPGIFGGPNYIVASDPTFAGGAVPYSFSTSVQSQTSAEGNVSLGGITTVNGSAKTGGGNTGGTGGTRGGRGYNM